MDWTTQQCLFSESDLWPSAVNPHRDSMGPRPPPFPCRLCGHLSTWLHPFGKYTSRVMLCQYFTQLGSTSVTILSTLFVFPPSMQGLCPQCWASEQRTHWYYWCVGLQTLQGAFSAQSKTVVSTEYYKGSSGSRHQAWVTAAIFYSTRTGHILHTVPLQLSVINSFL